nr:hypothetical protein [Tanacetum cinerariifolium]
MATTIEQQVTLDEALVPSTKRLRIGRSNFRLLSDIQSKESTLSPFFKAFLVMADVPEIYMQEFWATTYVHQHSIRFKMDTRKNIVDLEAFREMLHISPRVPGQSFDELPFEEEILDFLRFLGHSAQIKTLTDVNVNKLFQPWRSFTAVINKFLTGKSSGFDSLRDDILFSTIKVVSRHQNTQQYGVILPIKLTSEDIRNTKAYKEYYACATGEAAPKPKASARRKKGKSDSSTTPPTTVASPRPITMVAAAPRLTAATKGKQPARATSPTVPSEGRHDDEGEKNDESDAADDDQDDAEKDDDDDDDDDEEEIAKLDEQKDTKSDEGTAEETESDEESVEEETREEEEESFDPIPRTPEESEDDGNGEEDQRLRGWGLQVSQDIEDSHVTITSVQPDDQVKSLEVNFSEFMQTNQFAEAVSKIPADLTEMELKKILIEKMEGNKSIQRSDKQRNLYKALVDAYEAYKTILESYGDTTILKRRRGSIRTSNQKCKQTTCQIDEPPHPVFETGAEDQPIVQTSQHPEWFSQPRKPPTPNHDWNKTLPAIQGSAQTWISELAKQADSHSSFNELLDTPIDFSNFIMNQLCVDTLTPEL